MYTSFLHIDLFSSTLLSPFPYIHINYIWSGMYLNCGKTIKTLVLRQVLSKVHVGPPSWANTRHVFAKYRIEWVFPSCFGTSGLVLSQYHMNCIYMRICQAATWGQYVIILEQGCKTVKLKMFPSCFRTSAAVAISYQLCDIHMYLHEDLPAHHVRPICNHTISLAMLQNSKTEEFSTCSTPFWTVQS